MPYKGTSNQKNSCGCMKYSAQAPLTRLIAQKDGGRHTDASRDERSTRSNDSDPKETTRRKSPSPTRGGGAYGGRRLSDAKR